MKVLVLSNFIYDINQPVFNKNACGFGIMVNDIVNAIAENNDVYLLTRAFHAARQVNKYKLMAHRKRDFIKSISIHNLIKSMIVFLSCEEPIRMKLRYAYYNLDMGSVKKAINEIKPDIVHVHGLSYSTKQYIDLLREMKIPFVVTLHGLIGLDESVKASKHDKFYEKEFLLLSEKENIPVTVISSGIKSRIQKYYNISAKNVFVVLNGIDTNIKRYTDEELDGFRSELGINRCDKVIVFIGNITKNKNQEQLIDAINLISTDIKQYIKVYFAGKDVLQGKLQKKTEEYGLSKIISFLGFLNKNDIHKLYDIADLNIFTSLNDGFGLPIVEGFLHGVPVVTYSDLDSFKDICETDATVVPRDRTTKELAVAIERALNYRWDKKKIKALAKKYTLENMEKAYCNVYMRMKKDGE